MINKNTTPNQSASTGALKPEERDSDTGSLKVPALVTRASARWHDLHIGMSHRRSLARSILRDQNIDGRLGLNVRPRHTVNPSLKKMRSVCGFIDEVMFMVSSAVACLCRELTT